MNDSGRSIAAARAVLQGGSPTSLLVVHDDVDLERRTPPGRGAAAGSPGTTACARSRSALGTQDFLRLRIGVGRPGRGDRVRSPTTCCRRSSRRRTSTRWSPALRTRWRRSRSKASRRRSSASIDPKPARFGSHRSTYPDHPRVGRGLGMGSARVLRSASRIAFEGRGTPVPSLVMDLPCCTRSSASSPRASASARSSRSCPRPARASPSPRCRSSSPRSTRSSAARSSCSRPRTPTRATPPRPPAGSSATTASRSSRAAA